jgi:hypothetical protein
MLFSRVVDFIIQNSRHFTRNAELLFPSAVANLSIVAKFLPAPHMASNLYPEG